MAHQKINSEQHAGVPDADAIGAPMGSCNAPVEMTEGVAPGAVLIVSDDAGWSGRVRDALDASGILQLHARDAATADRHLRTRTEDLGAMIVDMELPDACGLSLLPVADDARVASVLAHRSPSVSDAVAAVRAGATDLLAGDTADSELIDRIRNTIATTRERRATDRKLTELTEACRTLNDSRTEVVEHVDQMAGDLVQAYQELTEHMNQVTTAAEFNSLVRQELDIESLLRTTLEFVLTRSGPTNAAIFLPTTTGDYSLGAYVNYDCPKDTVDILLDHLANSVAPRFESALTLEHLRTPEEFDAIIGDDADWLSDQEVIALACYHEDECLAIVMLFRDRRTPFLEPLPEQMETVAALFADQLARVIQVHHRHIPKDKWAAPGDPEEEDYDEFGGGGGLAA